MHTDHESLVRLWEQLEEDEKDQLIPALLTRMESWRRAAIDREGCLFWLRRRFERTQPGASGANCLSTI